MRQIFVENSLFCIRNGLYRITNQNKTDKKMYASLATIIFLLISVFDVFPDVENTATPPLTWVSPEEFSVNNTNTIRIAVDVSGDVYKNDIEKIIFSAQCFDYRGFYVEQKIGEVTKAPYEIIWDCSQIPDQNMGKLVFACEVHYGNNTTMGNKVALYHNGSFVLDRNRILKNERLLSEYINNNVIIDGFLDEWPKTETFVFTNADNKIFFFIDNNIINTNLL